MRIPTSKSIVAFFRPALMLIASFLCLEGIAAGTQDANDCEKDLEQVRKLVAHAERFQKIGQNDFSHLGHCYVEALIAAERFDEAFAKINSSNATIISYFEDYAVARFWAGRLDGLEQQIDELLEFQTEYFDESKSWFVERLEKLKAATKALCEIKNQSEGAISYVLRQIENRVAYGAMGSEEFWIRTTLVVGGKGAAEQLVNRIVEKGTDASNLKSPKNELLLHMQPRSVFFSYRKERHEAKRKVAYAELVNRARMPLIDWLFSAIKVMRYESTTPSQRDQLVREVLMLLDDGSLPEYKRSQIRWQLIENLARVEKHELVIDILEDHPPVASDIFLFGQLCEKVNLNQQQFIDRLISLLPTGNETHAYSESLMDFLLRTGHVSKARENVDSLSPPIAERYRKIIGFYETLHKTNFEGRTELARLYASFRAEYEFDSSLFTFLFNDLGTDHLAQIAINCDPECALKVARSIPIDKYKHYNDSNAVGLCAAALLRRGRIDLALKLAQHAKPVEIEKARITKLNDAPIVLDQLAWCELDTVAPNDRVVLSHLIRVAIENNDKEQALKLARRAFLHHRSLCGTESHFAKSEWVNDILDLSEIVTKDESGNEISGRYQKRFAKTIGLLMDFESAEDAIEFSRKKVKRGKYGAEFLLKLSVKWKEELVR